MPLRAGVPPFPLGFMEEICPTPFANRGAEVDWMRTFWDMHTNGTSPPSFTTMMNWIHDAYVTDYSWDNAFTELDYEANQLSGQINTSWDNAHPQHGIDHP